MAAMLTKESGGNTCAANSCCVGIGQLNVNTSAGGLDLSQYGMTRSQYQNADLQTQINIWSVQANMNTQSSGYQTLNNAYQNGQPLDGTPVTPGMLAACEQFGAAVCNHNVSSLQSTGACGSYTDGNGHTGGQTICSWGATADRQPPTRIVPMEPRRRRLSRQIVRAQLNKTLGRPQSPPIPHPSPPSPHRRSQAQLANHPSPAPTLLFRAPKSSACRRLDRAVAEGAIRADLKTPGPLSVGDRTENGPAPSLAG
jgi:hypothetical protein